MRKIFHRFFALVLAVGSILLCADSVQACSCVVNPTVDIAFEKTPNIAILKIKDVQTIDYAGNPQTFISKMTVEKVFKGNLKVGQELSFGVTGTSCDYTFPKESVGSEMLLYLNEKPNKSGIWYYPACTRSTWVKDGIADLKYIENINEVRGRTRLSGTIYQDKPAQNQYSNYQSLPNRSVKISGNGKNIELKTDENGFYEIYDLSVGKYKITVEKIEGYKLGWLKKIDFFDVTIKTNSHTEQNIVYGIDNVVSGKFFDANGVFLKDVCIHLNPADGSKGSYLGDCTKEDGGFEIDDIPIGDYVIVVNNDGEISADEPFGTFYYPNVTKREEAQVFKIGAGQQIKDLKIIAPTTAETITISGKVVFQNAVGTKTDDYEYVAVEFKPDKDEKGTTKINGESRAVTDNKGNFSIRILKGQKGILYGTMTSYTGKYVNCPKLDRLVRAKGDGVEDIETTPLKLTAEKNLSGVVFKFPFPSCKKAKIN